MADDLRKNRGARRYVDVQREGPPRFPGDPQIDEPGNDDGPEFDLTDEEPEPPTTNVFC